MADGPRDSYGENSALAALLKPHNAAILGCCITMFSLMIFGILLGMDATAKPWPFLLTMAFSYAAHYFFAWAFGRRPTQLRRAGNGLDTKPDD